MPKKLGLPRATATVGKKQRGKEAPVKRTAVKTESETKGRRSLYPTAELAALNVRGSDDEWDTLDSADEAELDEEAARYEEERYHPDEWPPKHRMVASAPPPPATAPPPTAPPPQYRPRSRMTLLPNKIKQRLGLAYPVFETNEDERGRERVHAPVEYAQIRELAKAVRDYGVNANLTLATLERFSLAPMTPSDWQDIVKATLPSMGQYLEWKAFWHEASRDQARLNASALTVEQRDWSYEMLTGQGPHAHEQAYYPWGVYGQVARCAIQAWKALPRRGEDTRALTKIRQGATEPFSDFVARMTETAERVFGDSLQTTIIVKQLVFEQATTECRRVLAPMREKGIDDWVTACRDIGGPLTNSGLAAAILQGQKNSGDSRNRVCYNCGKPGHLRKDCRSKGPKKEPGLCPRCKKGRHWARDCRSTVDLQGNPLPTGAGSQDSNYWDRSTAMGLTRSRREPISALTLALILGLGAAGAGTGIASLVTSSQNYAQLSMAIDADIQEIQSGMQNLKDSVASLTEVVLQNRRGLDMLFLQQGGLYAALKEECCF